MDASEHFDSCAICERTILRGERLTAYVTPDGEEVGVCALCLERAEAAGWQRADVVAATGRATGPRRRRGLRLRERVKAATERARPPERTRPPEPEPAPEPVFDPDPDPEPPLDPIGSEEPARVPDPAPPVPEPEPEPELEPESEVATEPDAEPEAPERHIRHAIGAFNDSDQPRVVAGLMRSLGEPNAAIAATDAEPPMALVTVAWELSWYRWEVAADGTAGVKEVAKGGEVSEIDGGVPEWNAGVNEEGKLRWRGGS